MRGYGWCMAERCLYQSVLCFGRKRKKGHLLLIEVSAHEKLPSRSISRQYCCTGTGASRLRDDLCAASFLSRRALDVHQSKHHLRFYLLTLQTPLRLSPPEPKFRSACRLWRSLRFSYGWRSLPRARKTPSNAPFWSSSPYRYSFF